MPLDFSHRRAGKLVMYWNAKGLQGARRQVDFQAGHGSRQEVLSLSRCIEVEPALAHAKARWVGGVYTPDEDVGDCAEFCRKLVVMMQTDLKFKFLHSVRISGLRVSDGLLRAVHGVGQVIEADRYVLALGTESIDFARMAGFSLPLYPLKGYSITVPLEAGMAGVPSVSITDLSRKIVYARLGERLRVAGRIELVGRDRSISPVAIQNLASATASLFPGLQGATKGKNSKDLSPWIGFRPATPTGMPIVDVSPVKNLFLNVGHGALGWTLACGSASILADRIAGRNPVIDAAAFDFR
jgi:D-amino-acid dehydrogenase